MNMIKNNGGFTLVELIVVIAILGILAGIAVPAYSGYIAHANDAACLSELSAIQTAAQACCAMDGETLASVTIATDGTITIADANTSNTDAYDITEFYTAPTNLMTTLAKHSNYTTASAGGIQWTEAGGWDLLAEPTT